ncbi:MULTISPECIES: DUF2188 domain-containing protein [Vibrio]|jgi:hypothetical protein|uniref:DUF2188 domain-containing protein n=3 Tax=Vibrio aestuarianus TaxID=28171 RepID=A0ABN8TQM3_9VIBR|nr:MULTISPECIES: DUF2188 domain-containing protein [Vibrio]EJL6485262.1 DUF2188 domain-containing protein [Vibrio cholerae]EJL6560511.1 DUF2188 domain-containing protein [Vibrio cholerae]EKN8283796.1 DUF2188 domain-containing protein [Vibrio cholerae]ELB7342636.1 DUF2188 domain-containing protein [Vibrio cholerae]ELC9568428.1 DUF2188 domain-containing protein [Vibrio cholerae]
MKIQYSVFKNKESEWCISTLDKKKIVARFTTQKEAISAARQMAQKSNSTMIIHDKDGQIRSVIGLKKRVLMRNVKTNSKLKTQDINIAVARAMEKQAVKG